MPTVKNYDHRFLAINLPTRNNQDGAVAKLKAICPDMLVMGCYYNTSIPATHVILLIDLGCEPNHVIRNWLDQRENEGAITFWHTYYPEKGEQSNV